MRLIVFMVIIFKFTKCLRTKGLNGSLKFSDAVKVAHGEIYVEAAVGDHEITGLLEEKFKFFNDNTSRRYKTMGYDDIDEMKSESDGDFRAIPERRIIGGLQTSIRLYPYNVAIARNGKHWCGGSVIDEQWILTAGHCMESAFDGDKKKLNPFIIRAGSSFHSKGGYQARINKVFFPSEYEPGHADYDFALLRLDRPLPIGKNIAVVNLPSKTYAIKTSEMLVVTGWGSTAESGIGSTSAVLRFVPVPTISQKSCQDSYHFYISPRMLCAAYKKGGMDACNHDSGGPAVRDGVLMGVVSFGGKRCGDPRSPGVYSRVSEMTEWIDKTISTNEAYLVPELKNKIRKARVREEEMRTLKEHLESKKIKIKKWLQALLKSSKFMEKAKKKLEEVRNDMSSQRKFYDVTEKDEDTLYNINLSNAITELIFEGETIDDRDAPLMVLAVSEMIKPNRESPHS